MVKLLYRVEEAAELLGLGRSKTYELISRGEIGSVRVDGAIRVPQTAIEDFIYALPRGVHRTPAH